MKLLASKEFLCFPLDAESSCATGIVRFRHKEDIFMSPDFMCFQFFWFESLVEKHFFLYISALRLLSSIYTEWYPSVWPQTIKNCERHKGLPICVISLLYLCRLSLEALTPLKLKMSGYCGYVPSVNVSYFKMTLLNKTGMIIQC